MTTEISTYHIFKKVQSLLIVPIVDKCANVNAVFTAHGKSRANLCHCLASSAVRQPQPHRVHQLPVGPSLRRQKTRKITMECGAQPTPVMEEYAGDVECVRYLVVFTIFSLVGLVVDPLPKIFPSFFLANLIWSLTTGKSLSHS